MYKKLLHTITILKNAFFVWQYGRHLKRRIEKNNFGRREEW
tara:strand:- start:953 stop:1075 length:123 start_codon:yes stop_codon:yes gene_type:complete